ncbi:hypothetical protein EDC05_006599, partial [Coemansia umbellata]
MPGVLTIITDELVSRASELSNSLCTEIALLLDVLRQLKPVEELADGAGDESNDANATPGQKTPSELSTELLDMIRDITLSKFSPASSHQSRLLRLLMAIDYNTTTVTKRLEERQSVGASSSANPTTEDTTPNAATAETDPAGGNPPTQEQQLKRKP